MPAAIPGWLALLLAAAVFLTMLSLGLMLGREQLQAALRRRMVLGALLFGTLIPLPLVAVGAVKLLGITGAAAAGILLMRIELHDGLLAEARSALESDTVVARSATQGQVCGHCGVELSVGAAFPLINGRSSMVRMPGSAAHTAGTVFTQCAAVPTMPYSGPSPTTSEWKPFTVIVTSGLPRTSIS